MLYIMELHEYLISNLVLAYSIFKKIYAFIPCLFENKF
jgi:hypothetical protein